MSKITNNVSKMMSMVSSDMTVYVTEENEEMFEELKRGWPSWDIQLIHEDNVGVMDVAEHSLVILSDHQFCVNF